jgi:putative Mn2+ efflux pump MntP
MSFGIYIIGFIIMVIGVALGAFYLHVPAHWIAVTVLIMIGLGVASGVSNTRHKDPS